MSSKYQAPFTIPEAFPELLKYFTREVLRSQVGGTSLSFHHALLMLQKLVDPEFFVCVRCGHWRD